MRAAASTDTPSLPPAGIDPAAQRRARIALWVLALAAIANALLFARHIANPMLMADNWLFADTFLVHVIDDGGGFGDFLVKRAGLDHGLPHYKLMMYLNARWFGLDFTLEAMAGVVFAALGWLVLARMATRDVPPSARPPALYLLLAAMAAVQLSLNAYYTYLYSMVTLGFVDYLLAFLVFHAAWRVLEGRAAWPFACWALVYAVAADTSATLTGIALAIAALFAGWRLQRLQRLRRALVVVAIMVAALLVARVTYAVFGEVRGSTLAVFNAPLDARLAGMAAHAGDAWRWVISPAASGVAWRNALQGLFGAGWQAAQVALGLLVVAAHGWFWVRALRDRPVAASFAAICLMLLFYGYIAGVAYGRVFVRGSGYFDQGRYVSLYQIGILALLLMAAARVAARPFDRRAQLGAAAAALLLLAVQLPLSLQSWRAAPGILGYYDVMAAQYGDVVRDPLAQRDCVDQLTICGLPQDTRVRVVDMLREHRLGMFSPRFARAHPELVQAAGPLPVAATRRPPSLPAPSPDPDPDAGVMPAPAVPAPR